MWQDYAANNYHIKASQKVQKSGDSTITLYETQITLTQQWTINTLAPMTCKYYTEIGKSLRKFRLYFKGHFSTWTWVTTLSPFWILLEQRMMEVAVNNARPVRSAKLQSICLHQQANIQHFTGPSCCPKSYTRCI